MVDAEKDEKGPTLAGRQSERGGVRRADGGAYTQQDAALFEKLADFSSVRSRPGAGMKISADASPGVPATGAFEYSDADAREFDRLMDQLSGYRGLGRAVKPRSRTAAGGGYTEGDDRLFSELMSADRFPTQAAPRERRPAERRPDESNVQYAQRDVDAFGKIMSGSLSTEDGGSEGGRERRSRTDRDVGTIRIVDFDKERARARATRKRGNENIKIRYFD